MTHSNGTRWTAMAAFVAAVALSAAACSSSGNATDSSTDSLVAPTAAPVTTTTEDETARAEYCALETAAINGEQARIAEIASTVREVLRGLSSQHDLERIRVGTDAAAAINDTTAAAEDLVPDIRDLEARASKYLNDCLGLLTETGQMEAALDAAAPPFDIEAFLELEALRSAFADCGSQPMSLTETCWRGG